MLNQAKKETTKTQTPQNDCPQNSSLKAWGVGREHISSIRSYFLKPSYFLNIFLFPLFFLPISRPQQPPRLLGDTPGASHNIEIKRNFILLFPI